MPIEVNRLRRLRAMMLASLDSSSNSELVRSYSRVRKEVIDAIDEPHTSEFERLFPEKLEGGSLQGLSSQVKTLMAQMGGWLDEIIGSPRKAKGS